MKVRVDEDVCTSCGLCVDTCPDVFEMGDEAAYVKAEVVPPHLEDKVQEAADNCPVECIEVQD